MPAATLSSGLTRAASITTADPHMPTSIRSKTALILFGIVAVALTATLGACVVVLFAIAPLLAAADRARDDAPATAGRPDRQSRQADVEPIGIDLVERRRQRR